MATISAKMALLGVCKGTLLRMPGVVVDATSSTKTNRVFFNTLPRAVQYAAAGEEMRETSKGAAKEMGDKASSTAEEAKEKVQEAWESAKGTGQKVKDTVSAKTDEIKETLEQKTEDAKSKMQSSD